MSFSTPCVGAKTVARLRTTEGSIDSMEITYLFTAALIQGKGSRHSDIDATFAVARCSGASLCNVDQLPWRLPQ